MIILRNLFIKIILAGIFSILVAGSTSATAWLLDPAIEKIFLEKDKTLIYLIPLSDNCCIFNKRYRSL